MSNNVDVKEIRGFADYIITSSGEVFKKAVVDRRGRAYKSKKMAVVDNGNGYLRLNLRKDGISYKRYVHRLVAEAFISNPNSLPEVDHIDTNRKNNNASNLRWCTRSMNNHNELSRHKQSTSHIGKSYDSLKKKVLVYDCDGKFIGEFDSGRDVQNALGVDRREVSSCCRGHQKTAKGYKFKFK